MRHPNKNMKWKYTGMNDKKWEKFMILLQRNPFISHPLRCLWWQLSPSKSYSHLTGLPVSIKLVSLIFPFLFWEFFPSFHQIPFMFIFNFYESCRILSSSSYIISQKLLSFIVKKYVSLRNCNVVNYLLLLKKKISLMFYKLVLLHTCATCNLKHVTISATVNERALRTGVNKTEQLRIYLMRELWDVCVPLRKSGN